MAVRPLRAFTILAKDRNDENIVIFFRPRNLSRESQKSDQICCRSNQDHELWKNARKTSLLQKMTQD
jgi:hypothetical protein